MSNLPLSHHLSQPDANSTQPDFQTFRLLFFSLMAATVLQTLPHALEAAGISFLLFVAIILFCSSIEVLLKLDEGNLKNDAAKRIAFFFDVFAVIPAFLFTAFQIQRYSESVIELGERLHIPSGDLVAILAEPYDLVAISLCFCLTFLVLLCRGLIDRLILKDSLTLESKSWPWIAAHIWGILVSAVAALFCYRAAKYSATKQNESLSQAYSRILGLSPSSETLQRLSLYSDLILAASATSLVLLVGYLLWYYAKLRLVFAQD